MKTKMAVLTATRAEYGLLSPIIHKLMKSELFEIRVIVTGAHLSPEFGLTYKEIEEDGVNIDKKIEILLSSDSPAAISKSMGLAMIGFAEYFEEKQPDVLLVLGDRYETLAVCCAAMNARIPIVHLYGGETTEGAIDEAVRHSITKMSYLHFTSTETYRRRVIQLGEDPCRVFTVGSIGIENALKVELLSKEELENSLQFSLDRSYAVVTFHPTTLENGQTEKQINELLSALDERNELNYIFTKANADANGRIINEMIDKYACARDNVAAFTSLGMKRYLSALKYSVMVIGNSSSGIVETPSFKIPTVNIGDRQKGRLQAESVINCEPLCRDITQAIDKALSDDFKKVVKSVKNPYGDGNTSNKIVKILEKSFQSYKVDLKKKFYDLSCINE